MKLSDFLVKEIFELTKTEKFFGYIGGMCTHIIDSIFLNNDVEFISTITEQGAGFASEGYARANGKTGVAVVTSGPGATNLTTCIANCFFDSTPVLFITGQVNTYEYQKYNIRQTGFQETDIVKIVKPITKYAKTIFRADEIKYEIQKAIHIANNGRCGPVLLDIPMDIQRADVDIKSLSEYTEEREKYEINFDTNILTKSKKPLLLIGNGVNLSKSKRELQEFLLKHNIPTAESLLGIDCVQSNYEYNMGLIGAYGNRASNFALYESDLLIVLGSRLDIRQTGAKIDFMNNKTIIHCDIDKDEINCPKFQKIKIHADIKEFLSYLNSREINFNIKKWQKACLYLKEKFPNQKKEYYLPNKILEEIFRTIDKNAKISCDVGQNQVWAAQSAIIKENTRLFSSGGHGCMGFSLPAAIGASFPNNISYAITGDGGFQMNIQELEIIKRRNLPVKIIILNNKNLGMVRTFQELYFEGRLFSTVEDYSAPNFEKIALAYGIKAKTIEACKFNIKEIESDLKSKEPSVFNIIFEQKTQVEPRLQFGNSIENAHPLIDTKEVIKEISYLL